MLGQIENALKILEDAGYNTKELAVNMGITDQKRCGYWKRNHGKILGVQGAEDVNITCTVDLGLDFD